MANPQVRPHLSFYPEDTGPKLSQARQGQRWLTEIADDQTTPMARLTGKDYFIYEPTMLRDGKFCIPVRWFTRNSNLVAKCWELIPVNTETHSGWRAIKSSILEVPQEHFLKNFPELKTDCALYGVPDPSKILGLFVFLCIVMG